MMRVAATAAILLTLCGCVSTTTGPGLKPVESASQEQTTRMRARVHTELAASYYDLGNMAIALQEIKEALAADSDYGPAYNVAGLIYAELKEDKLAHENFQRALRIDALDSDSNNNYGRFLCDRGREAEAIKYFLAALRNPLYQTPDRSYVNAGLCSRRQGHTDAAEKYFLQALKVRPMQPQALYQLADIAYGRNEFARAKEYLVRLEQVAPPTPEVLWLALRVERKLGDRNAEEAYAAQLRRGFPDSKEAGALLAGRYE
ncbi:MAG: type IV pilus biogenesis/stability protein PilW [Burkholderiales bacterium]